MADLHVDSYGSGTPLVMLHGWGMHGGMWGSAVTKLAQHYRVHCVDLPGHGYSALPSTASGKGAGVEGKVITSESLTLTLWMKQLAIRLGCQKTAAKSLVIPKGEGTEFGCYRRSAIGKI